MEKNHPISELMSTTMQKIREMVDVNTIVGTPIHTEDGVTLIPVSRLSFGLPPAAATLPPRTRSPTPTTPSAEAAAPASTSLRWPFSSSRGTR